MVPERPRVPYGPDGVLVRKRPLRGGRGFNGLASCNRPMRGNRFGRIGRRVLIFPSIVLSVYQRTCTALS